MQTTTNYSFKKRELTDVADITTTESNWDMVDAQLKTNADANTSHIVDNTKHKQASGITQTGSYANAEGYQTVANGVQSHAEGHQSIASGDVSHAEGYGTTAGGAYAHSEGLYTEASGIHSHAEGERTTVKTMNAHVEGQSNLVYGNAGHAEGTNNIAMAGAVVYKITAYNNTAKTLTLDSVTNLAAGTVLTVKRLNYAAISDITISSISGLVVTLNTTETIDSSWTHAISHYGTSWYSQHAEGDNNIASGHIAHAEGEGTIASGNYSHAEGYNTLASASRSHAEGDNTIASGFASHAEGLYTIASSDESHAEGNETLASGVRSHAEGEKTTASGRNSHAEGINTTASGESSHAEGSRCLVYGKYGHAEGSCTLAMSAASIYKITAYNDTNKTITLDSVTDLAVGTTLTIKRLDNPTILDITITAISDLTVTLDTTESINSTWKYALTYSSSWYSFHAEGNNNTACGHCAHAEGAQTVASGYNSHAEGYQTEASGAYSHAEGSTTVASGEASHVEGQGTVANEKDSHAEGYYTTASGRYSHSGGKNTAASVFASRVTGTYNKALNGNTTTYSGTADAFVIGNGTSDTAKGNAFRVTFDGKTYGLSAFNSTGADYAEYFEWADANPDKEDRVGYFVALDREKIRIASSNDEILGAISAQPSVVGDSYNDDWCGKYLTDYFGRIKYHDVTVAATYRIVHHDAVYEDNWIEPVFDDKGNIVMEGYMHHTLITEAYDEQVIDIPEHTERQPVYNPAWDPTQEYIPREQRPEWAAVGMMGKILVRDDGTCQVNGHCKPNNNGIATASVSGYSVLKRITNNIILILMK